MMITSRLALVCLLSGCSAVPTTTKPVPPSAPSAPIVETAPASSVQPQGLIGFGAATVTTQSAVLPSMVTPWTKPYFAHSGDDINCHGASVVSSAEASIVVVNVSNVRIHNCKFSSALTQLPPAGRGFGTKSVCKTAKLPVDVFGCGIPVHVWGESRNVYIDHNDMTQCGEKCLAIDTQEEAAPLPDGTTPAPDNVSVVLNKFSASYFGIAEMAQKGISTSALPHPMRLTVAFNLFDGVYRRSARGQSSSAQIDETGNVIRNWTWPSVSGCEKFKGFGPSSLGGAQLLLRNNVIDAAGSCPTATDISDYMATDGTDRGVGYIKTAGDLLLNGALEFQSEPQNVTFVAPSYAIPPVSQVEAYVMANAGMQ